MQAWHLFRRTSVSDCFCTALPPLAYRFYFIFSTYRSSHWRCSVKKGVLWNFERPATFLRTCFYRTICRTLLDDCFCTFFLNITATTVNISDACVLFKFKRLQRIWMWYVIFTESLPSLFFFFHDFLSFSVLLCFFLPLLIKRTLLKWELIKMFLPPLTSLKYVHVSK